MIYLFTEKLYEDEDVHFFYNNETKQFISINRIYNQGFSDVVHIIDGYIYESIDAIPYYEIPESLLYLNIHDNDKRNEMLLDILFIKIIEKL
jgi:hypothetical protein